MSLKDLLVHLDTGTHCQSRLETAVSLAIAHRAHLTGIFVITRTQIPTYMEVQIGPKVLEAEAAAADKVAKEVETRFRDRVERAGISYEWRCVEGQPVDCLNLHARYCDIAVVGQQGPENYVSNDMPDHLILSVGRPVLVVPYVGDYPVVGKQIMIAWDGSRLAARAVNDAIPFLKRAKHVDVMAVNPKIGSEGLGDIPCADICLHLARHGIEAEAKHMVADDMDEGDMLLSRAADAGTDLMVMGAYGHARWRELVLGGVTQYMLKHMTMPVLMSH